MLIDIRTTACEIFKQKSISKCFLWKVFFLYSYNRNMQNKYRRKLFVLSRQMNPWQNKRTPYQQSHNKSLYLAKHVFIFYKMNHLLVRIHVGYIFYLLYQDVTNLLIIELLKHYDAGSTHGMLSKPSMRQTTMRSRRSKPESHTVP